MTRSRPPIDAGSADDADGADPDDAAIDLAGETAVITGGTRGIGLATAERFAAAGATTIATFRGDEDAARAAEATLADYDAPTATRRFDVGDPEAVRTAFAAIREDHGPPTVLVNNAGIVENDLLLRTDASQWERVLRTNLTGTFNCTKAAVRGMLRGSGGAVVNVSSVAARRGWAGQCSYAASKAGVEGFTRAAARELGDRGVRVNAVCPGYVATDLYEEAVAAADGPDLDAIPADRIAEPAEVADAIAFLASDDASYVDGTVLRVDGGRLA